MSEWRTCNWGFNVDHGLLRAEERGAIGDDAQRSRFIDAALEDEVLLEHVRPWLVGPRVVDICYR